MDLLPIYSTRKITIRVNRAASILSEVARHCCPHISCSMSLRFFHTATTLALERENWGISLELYSFIKFFSYEIKVFHYPILTYIGRAMIVLTTSTNSCCVPLLCFSRDKGSLYIWLWDSLTIDPIIINGALEPLNITSVLVWALFMARLEIL